MLMMSWGQRIRSVLAVLTVGLSAALLAGTLGPAGATPNGKALYKEAHISTAGDPCYGQRENQSRQRTARLTIVKKGAGTGIVTSDPPGIDCGDDCIEDFIALTCVYLTAIPDEGFLFVGWSGDNQDCLDGVVYMDQDMTCIAEFLTPAVFIVSRDGTVYSDRAFFCGLPQHCFNSGVGADLAERIEVTEPVEPGDVVEFDPSHPGRYRKARGPNSPFAAGVIASFPGITLGNSLAEQEEVIKYLRGVQVFSEVGIRPWLTSGRVFLQPDEKWGLGSPIERISLDHLRRIQSDKIAIMHTAFPFLSVSLRDLFDNQEWKLALKKVLARLPGRPLMALMGRVYAKATTENGPIQVGDLLTTASEPGYVMRCTSVSQCAGALVGKALEPLNEGKGLIQILVVR